MSRGLAEMTKFKALLKDLSELRQTNPHMHAVVFTSSVPVYNNLCLLLAQKGYVVCSFKGGDPPNKRDQSIRTFQAGAARPTV